MRSATVCLAALLGLLPGLLSCAPRADGAPSGLKVLADGVEIPAVVHADSFARNLLGLGMPGYHLLVTEGGRSAGAALFTTGVSDLEVLDAFEHLGAQPGNGLGLDTWNQRNDPAAKAPDKVIVGPAVVAELLLPGRAEPLGLGDFLLDPGGRGFALRLGGHRANVSSWRSGCIICLYSCPGSKIGNARYTVRDYVEKATRFGVKPGVLPADGTHVRMRLRLAPAG